MENRYNDSHYQRKGIYNKREFLKEDTRKKIRDIN